MANGSAALTPAEATARARAFIPVLAERAAKTEALRRIPDDTFADLTGSALMRITQPRRFGGSELHLADAFDVINLLSQGCGSTGWTYSLVIAHGWFVALFGEQAQQEVWGPNPDAIMSTCFSGGGPPDAVDGGLHVRAGRWRFSTGVHHADWVALLAPVIQRDGPPDMRFLLIPKDEIQVVEDWRSAGLAGTGSCSVQAEDVFVPHHRTLRLTDLLDATSPGSRVNDGPMYQLPLVGPWQVFLTAPAVGIGRAAMDAWIDQAKGKERPTAGASPPGDASGLARLGGAAARIEAAETLIRRAAESVTSDVVALGAAAPATLARARRDNAYSVRLCVEAVEDLFLNAGASTLDEGSPLQRHWRDVHAVAQHKANNLDMNLRAWGERALGHNDGLRLG
ncbi:acyl-CoA dehydrogenase family protein [Spirillospora sp. CA-294931]|uniref:acyl-CoA dehydrogenase family protein n=1 Tax=Spirillospora sp. CA-294931 TaxID=3240042 RepID=UPI003D8C76D7